MCNFCASNSAVLPGIEAFERGIDIPIVYMLFYEFFFRSSVGDVRWKKVCQEEEDVYAPLGPPVAEAFAMLQLKNNYFAWLLDAKDNLRDKLFTDYDDDKKLTGKKNCAEAYLKKLEVNLVGSEEDELVVAESDEAYKDLKKRTDDMLKKARRSAKSNATYKELKKVLAKMKESEPQER